MDIDDIDLTAALQCDLVPGATQCEEDAAWRVYVLCPVCENPVPSTVLWCKLHMGDMMRGLVTFTCDLVDPHVKMPYTDIVTRIEPL